MICSFDFVCNRNFRRSTTSILLFVAFNIFQVRLAFSFSSNSKISLRRPSWFPCHHVSLAVSHPSDRIIMAATATPTEAMSAAATEALGKKVEFVSTSGGGGSGGGGATTGALVDTISGIKYFVKTARNKLDMLRAEYLGIKEMAETKTIQVPTPIAFGEHKPTGQAFAIFEYLEFCRGGSQFELGVQLAKVRVFVL